MSAILFNRFIEVRFMDGGKAIGGRQELVEGRVSIPPSIGFDVNHTSEPTPNDARITLHNVAPETQRALFVEGKLVELWAGYWPHGSSGEIGRIFRGQIRAVKTRMEGGIEVVSEIECGDSDDAIAHGRVRVKTEKGSTHKDAAKAAIAAMTGVKAGRVDVPDFAEPRARTVDRPAVRELDDIAVQHDLQWSVQDGVLNIYPRDAALNQSDLILTPDTGVLDAPEFGEKGVEVRTLMIPDLRPGMTFTLRNEHVRERAPGRYRIEEVNFSGDNFGGDFGCRIVATEMDGSKAKRSRERYTGNRN